MKKRLLVVTLSLLSGCGGYGSYPSFPGGAYGYPVSSPPNFGYGGYPVPAYGYYPGPIYYGRSYGGFGYADHDEHPSISNDQKALNYLYDHRNQIQRLPPQQQREILREANQIAHHHDQANHHAE